MAAAGPVKLAWTPDKKHSDIERWVCIYPAYINSKKTRQEGRRLPKERCVEYPTYIEIRDVLSTTNLRIAVENKQYPREKSKELNCRGRIRVQIKNDDGTAINSELASRDSLLNFLSAKIPQLKTRQNPKANEGPSAQPTQSSGGGGGGGAGHKKGKGKKR